MIAALLTALAFAQLPDSVYSARVIVDPPEAPFHKQITLTIEVVSDPDVDVMILPIDPAGLSGLTVFGAPEHIDELIGEERRRVAVVYMLDAIHPGDYAIAPAVVKVSDSMVRIPSPAIRIRKLTREEEANAMVVASNAEPVEMPPRSIVPWVLVGAGVFLAGFAAAYWFLRARPNRETGPPPRAPWELAYDRLRILDSAALPATGNFGKYYLELSNVIRHYVEDRYHLHAPERTTPEFLIEATKSGLLTSEQQDQLETLLKLCDRVKFARYGSSVEEAEQSMADILQFVDDSIPEEVVETEEDAA
jgi:hypothetical protein